MANTGQQSPYTSNFAPSPQAQQNPELQAQQMDLQRRQQMADLLRKQSLEPMGGTDMVDGWAVKKSPLEGLAKLAQALGANYSQGKVDEKQLGLSKALADHKSEEATSVFDALNGTPARAGIEIPSDAAGGGPGFADQPAVAGDRRKAMALALQSMNPAMQGVGNKLMESELAQEKFGHDVKFTAEGKGYLTGDKGGINWMSPQITPRDKMMPINLGDTTQFVNPYAPPSAPMNHAATPDAKLTDERVRSEGAANRGNSASIAAAGRAQSDRHFISTQQGSESAFSPDAITNAAARYNIDGTLPPMGMGKTGSAGRSAILNKAAELASGVTPDQQRITQMDNKNIVAARGTAIKSFATGKDGQAVQSANTALNHLDTVLELAKAQKAGDVRMFNQLANKFASQTGSAAPTNLKAALVMVAPEIVKSVVGAGGGVEDRARALEALNPDFSPSQIIGAAGTMQELFGGRLSEASRTYERTTGGKDFNAKFLSPAAQKIMKSREVHATTAGKPSLDDIFSGKK